MHMLLLTEAVLDPATLDLDIWSIFTRFICAMVVGIVIGMEREFTHRPAGLRTHVLVTLGACAVMITGQLIFVQYKALGGTPDPARLSAQVITGVGFLGAGTILREGTHVKGLTTAASLWAVACLGIAAGAGYYAVALLGMVLIFVTLTIFEVLQNKLVGPGKSLHRFTLHTDDISAGLNAVNTHASKPRPESRELLTHRQEDSTYRITSQPETGGTGSKKRRQKFLEALAADPAVDSLQAGCEESATLQ